MGKDLMSNWGFTTIVRLATVSFLWKIVVAIVILSLLGKCLFRCEVVTRRVTDLFYFSFLLQSEELLALLHTKRTPTAEALTLRFSEDEHLFSEDENAYMPVKQDDDA